VVAAKHPVEKPSSSSVVADVANRLSTKVLAGLIVLGLLLTATVLALAVARGSPVRLFGFVDIGERSTPATEARAMPVHFNLRFEPDGEVNIASPDVKVTGWVKTIRGGEQTIDQLRQGKELGSMYVDMEVSDPTQKMYFVVRTPKGIFRTEDFSVSSTRLTAFKQEPGQ
jgi:hypothetical protein